MMDYTQIEGTFWHFNTQFWNENTNKKLEVQNMYGEHNTKHNIKSFILSIRRLFQI